MFEPAENAPVQEPERKTKRRRKLLLFSVVSLLNVGILALILTQLLTPASHAVPDPLVGHPAPNFSLVVLGSVRGKHTLSLSDFKGKAIVLNFWASWCAPCQEELPLLESAWKRMQAQEKDVIFLGIDFQDSMSIATSFLQQNGVTYPAVLDTSGSVATKYYIASLPDTFFINRNGMVISKQLRELTSQILSSSLQSIA